MQKHVGFARTFLAETAWNDRIEMDLLSFERRLGLVADCVIVILESAGAIAELGAFSADDSLRRKLLVIVDAKYSSGTSFIRQGPLALVEKHSEFGAPIASNLREVLYNIDEVVRRLEGKLARDRRVPSKGLNLVIAETGWHPAANDAQQDLVADVRIDARNERAHLLFITDIVRLLSPVRWNEIVEFLRWIYGPRRFNAFIAHRQLALALGWIRKVDSDGGPWYLRTPDDLGFLADPFPDRGETRFLKMRADLLNLWFETSPERRRVAADAAPSPFSTGQSESKQA